MGKLDNEMKYYTWALCNNGMGIVGIKQTLSKTFDSKANSGVINVFKSLSISFKSYGCSVVSIISILKSTILSMF